ncbi:MAG: transcription elongation factor GreA [Fuerstiella sp.]|jgi:transcription elongation factor GreA|nr:transcription elongation factor GreA [Fuerstiella sp.]
MERQPISKEGYDKVRAEIQDLEEQKPAILERIKLAREEGDLKENAEYHAAREHLAHVERQIGEKRVKLSRCEIVDKADMPKGVVVFGSRVTVKDLADGMEEVYEMVGPGEEDYDGEILKILTSSPLAQAMIGKKVGDKFEAEIPAGTLKLQVVAIEDA